MKKYTDMSITHNTVVWSTSENEYLKYNKIYCLSKNANVYLQDFITPKDTLNFSSSCLEENHHNKEGFLHKEDGPAQVFSNGTKKWFFNGKLHREDGPAVEWNTNTCLYFIHGLAYSKEDYNEKMLNIRLQRLKEL